jgi:hypothetical protein
MLSLKELSAKYGVPSSSSRFQTLNVDLLEYHGDTILFRELSNSTVAVLLQHIEGDKKLEVHVAKGNCDAVSQSASTTRVTSFV